MVKKSKNIKRLFIANRGEVCRRIAISTHRLNIETASILPEKRIPAYLASHLDFYTKPSSEVASPYLDIEEMIRCAKDLGCDAIHPGFGFLSENESFASRCIEEGLLWVGPNPKCIKAMASKSEARKIAEKSKVPVTPGLQGIDLKNAKADLKKVESFVKENGFPILIKAAFGGGGKGMRLVYEHNQIEEALQRCHSEGISSFANGELLVERYIERPRHVEVQILGDKYGNVYAIGDRDCSLQRRHQKVIEEAPAPNIDPVTRSKMHAAAVNLAQQVGYDNAGTVEFLLEGTSKDQRFYFLEMNTRLQVEHPVTEEVYGIDLVAWQLRVALGEALPSSVAQIMPRGASIEARIYAEDPHQNFMPCPGRVDLFEPWQELGLRWEIGIDPADEITSKYDPMIAKCVASASNRSEAIAILQKGLNQSILFGVSNNLAFLAALLAENEFSSAEMSTHTIETHMEKILERSKQLQLDNHQGMALISESKAIGQDQSQSLGLGSRSFDDRIHAIYSKMGVSPTKASKKKYAILMRETVSAHPVDAKVLLHLKEVAFGKDGNSLKTLKHLNVKEPGKQIDWISFDGHTFNARIDRLSRADQLADDVIGGVDVKAPMPGKVISLKVSEGMSIDKNQTLAILESMKMEFEIKASRSGIVGKIMTKMGTQVTAGQTLIVWQD